MKNTSLRSRIFISCGLLFALCLLTSLIGWYGQTQILANFKTYEKTEQIYNNVLIIDRDILELKTRSENFIQTGAPSQHRAAETLHASLINQLTNAEFKNEDEGIEDLLAQMKFHITNFGLQLQSAAEERNIRTNLLQVELPEKGEEIEDAIAKLEINLGNENSKAFIELKDAKASFISARTNLLQYFANPNYKYFKDAITQLRLATNKIKNEIEINEQDDDSLGRSVENRIQDYRKLALRAFQATRGYMFYSNVVLAGEISDFVYYSNQLKQYVATLREDNQVARNFAAQRTRQSTIFFSIFALILAGILAARLSYSIVSPVMNLTSAFKSLADGETLEKIPGEERSDEIGRMSEAAKVFSLKNQETRELLQHAQKLSKELTDKASALEQTNQQLDNFAYVASHDLKSPLRGLDHLAQWVQEDCRDLLPEASQDHLKKMRLRVTKMNSLLDDLLNYSRIGKVLENVQDVDVNEVVNSAIEMTNIEKEIQFEIPEKLPTFKTVRAPFQQAMLNLIVNSMKYSDPKKKSLVKITSNDLGDFYSFTVWDNGIGIDTKHFIRVFQLFQRVASSAAEGTGMGLSMVKKQIENYGGSISVDSSLGEWTEFTFTWPKELSEHDLENRVVNTSEV